MVKLSLVLCMVISAMFALCRNSSVSVTDEAKVEKSQPKKSEADQKEKTLKVKGEDYRLVFYNVENLFDTRDDVGKNDAEFLPDSKIHWDTKLYTKKLNNITKVIKALGDDDDLPEIIALSEVENRSVLEDLLENLGQSENYGIVHRDSPDERGIDVALLYDKKTVKLKKESFHNVTLPEGDATREILQVEALLNNEPVHVFVNHWSSNYPSKKESEYKRLLAAETLNREVNKLQAKNKDAKIVIVGDFNDQPSDKSITEVLNAEENESAALYNLSTQWGKQRKGTIYRNKEEKWMTIDQILVSPAFMKGKGIKTSADKAQIFSPEWLTYRHKNGTQIPSRFVNSYTGKVYGGYSDHFPVYVDLK